LKHCSLERAEKLGALGRRFIDKRQPGLEAQLTNLADEIAYNCHDVDDGLRAGLIDLDGLQRVSLVAEQLQQVRQRYPELTGRRVVHEVVRRLINAQVIDLVENSRSLLQQSSPKSVDEVRLAGHALIGFSTGMRQRNGELKRFLYRNLYQHHRVHRRSVKARRIVSDLFEAFIQDSRLLPETEQRRIDAETQRRGDRGRTRVIADYIAGMTDRYAIAEYQRVIDPVA